MHNFKVDTNLSEKELFHFFSKSLPLYLYICGGLDNKFGANTSWYALQSGEKTLGIALLHRAENIPMLIALANENTTYAATLLKEIEDTLPESFYAYTAKSIIEKIRGYTAATDYGRYYQMYLKKSLPPVDDPNIRLLSMKDLEAAKKLYEVAYPDNFFTGSMLEKGIYLGYFKDNILTGIGGTNIFSKKYGIASIGDIAVHPLQRKQHIATKLTTTLCNILLPEMPHIGLSVHRDNIVPIAFYKKLGFAIVDEYEYKLMKRN